ncbi:hypothetical protein B7494_g3195 [Chlorociboria aeruginascens]|nr:hypothetical protein B7494_g3195 [Chlorociboria aeruginascens]
MANPQFTLAPCSLASIPSMIETHMSAFANDPFFSAGFVSRVSLPDLTRWLTARYTRQLSSSEIRIFGITDNQTGKVISWIRWEYPNNLAKEEKEQRDKKLREEIPCETWPIGTNEEFCKLIFATKDKYKQKYYKPEEMYFVQFLGTHSAYQGKGLAKMLLKHGLDLADAEGRKTYIEATDAGQPVYLKMGFRDIDSMAVNMSPFAEVVVHNKLMMRDPQPVQA